jgi:hypothetical protein
MVIVISVMGRFPCGKGVNAPLWLTSRVTSCGDYVKDGEGLRWGAKEWRKVWDLTRLGIFKAEMMPAGCTHLTETEKWEFVKCVPRHFCVVLNGPTIPHGLDVRIRVRRFFNI